MKKYVKAANLYIATLKALSLIHQNNHWTTSGDNFYGEHLLFERIYNSALENLDLAAEKFMGIVGKECLDYATQISLLNSVLSIYKKLEGNPIEMSLSAERDFLKLTEKVYEEFEGSGKMTMGLDDMLMAIASNREEAVYLLQQNLEK